MITETILTPLDIFKVSRRHEDDLYLLARAIEKAVLQSPEVQAFRKDAGRYRYIKKGSQWIVAATQTGFQVDGGDLDDLIDSEMEKQK